MAALGLLNEAAYAQPGEEVAPSVPSAPVLEGLAPLSDVLVLDTPPVDVVASRALSAPSGRFRFAEAFAVDVSPASHGRWETTSDGRTAVWRLRVVSAGSVSLNLGFTRYRMPPGGRLRIHTPDGSEVIGPFTDADNKAHGQLWTPVVSGGEAVIEVTVLASKVGELELELASVNRGFHDLVSQRSHGSCNVDVACSSADPYRDQVRSVGLYSIGGLDVLYGRSAQQHQPGPHTVLPDIRSLYQQQ